MFAQVIDFLVKLDKELFLFINLKLQNGFFDFLMPRVRSGAWYMTAAPFGMRDETFARQTTTPLAL